MIWVARIIAGIVLSVVAWFNMQPWIDIGYMASDMGMEIPFASALVNIWLIGPAIRFVLEFSASIVTVCVWFVIQTLQVMSLLAESPSARNQFSHIFKGFPFSSWVTENAEELKRLGWVAYGVEGFVCFLTYAPYGRGLEDFMADWGFWDADLWDGWAIATICLTVLMFEAAVIGICFFSGMFTSKKGARTSP